jgi:Protein of unknown function (DUF1549)/Protein of unknown function (DUF1553)
MRNLFFLLLLLPALAPAADKAADIAKTIDRHLNEDFKARKITPAPQADDAEFVRRVYLDLLGRIPKAADARTFIEDKAPNKRAKLIESLMEKPGAASTLAMHYRQQWLPETATDFQKQFQGDSFERYLAGRFAKRIPMDAIINQILTTNVAVGSRRFLPRNNNATPEEAGIEAFYNALEVKPENLGATVSRAWLGMKLECAQCHDHPFAPYKKEQFWNFAAFFVDINEIARISSSFVGPVPPQAFKNRIEIPGTGKYVVAKFFDGVEPDWSIAYPPMHELARWITDKKNPYFARNIVNRTWQQYFGIGLIDPIDEPSETNPPSHPKLLEELATLLKDADFDLHTLIAGIMTSEAYQRTSKQTHATQADARRFARMNLKGLTGVQIYQSVATATGYKPPSGEQNNFFQPSELNSFRALFPHPLKPADTQTSILQALTLMNGKIVTDQTSLKDSTVLAAIVDAPFLDTKKKVDAVFFTLLTRAPTVEEAEKFTSYVERGGPSGDKDQALADVYWVLLNSTEFLFNH